MLMEQAVRISEMMLAFALAIQSAEYIRGLQFEKYCGFVSLILSLLLFAGVGTVLVEAGLLFIAVILLYRFQGPYNGGSDCMTLLVLLCLFSSHVVPTKFWQEIALGYLAFQVVFSYFQSGYIKIINPDWRSGQALSDVFSITAYPVSEGIRSCAKSSRLIIAMSWVVIVFELLFPFSLLYQPLLIAALVVAITFHFANAWLFGLNRFFWIWPAGYPILFWFQSRVILPLIN
jgi:hypothetical protein